MEINQQIYTNGFTDHPVEQMKGEDKLAKIARLYAFISQVNQKIVRIKDEGVLFQNACDIAIEFGNFKIAWIGIFNKKHTKISLVCQTGIEAAYIKLFAGETFQANNPQLQVLLAGKYFVCNDIANTHEMEAWKPLATQHGIRSCIILPIEKSGKIIGSFNLYATENHFFDKEEINLLVEVTSDISFALNIFEKARRHKATDRLLVKNERRFRSLIENSFDMKTLSSKDGKIIYGSSSIQKWLGYSTKEFLIKYPHDLIHADDLQHYLRERSRIAKTPGKSYHFQQRRHHKNGSWVWCEGTITNMLDDTDVQAMVSNFVDISERKNAELQQEFDKNNLDALINSTTDLMWSVDKNYKLITFNRPLYNSIKLSTGKELVEGVDILSAAFSKEQSNRFKSFYERTFAGEAFTEIEYAENEIESWLEISYYPIRNKGEVIGAACHSRDITNIKKAERKLVESESRLNEAQALSHICNWEIDLLNKASTWSDEFYNIFGIRREENIQPSPKAFLSFVHPDDIDYAIKKMEDAIKHFANSSFYSRIITTDGSLKYIFIEYRFEFDKHQTPIRIYGIFHDITERKIAEQQLSESEAFNRGIFNSLSSHIAVVDKSGNIVAINEAWRKFSIENGDATLKATGVGSNYFQVCDKSSKAGLKIAEEVLQGIKDVIDEKQEAYYLEYPCNSPTQRRWFGMRVVRFDTDEPMVVVSHQNISERKLAEESLQLTQFTIDHAADAIFWMTPDARIINVNEAACRLLDYTKEELLALSVLDIDPDYDADKWVNHFIELRHNGSLFFETIQQAKEGSLVPVEIRANYIKFGDAELNCAFVRDISERKKADLERTRITNDLIERNKDLQQFAYIVSHNLRTPVANIMGITDIISSNPLGLKEEEQMMGHLKTSVNSLDEVIKDLNHILQVRHHINEQKETVYFFKLFEDIQQSIISLIKKENILFVIDFEQVDKMWTLKSYLYSIFFNLISNSIKYRSQHSRPVIEITSKKKGNKIEIIFKDNGLGIDMQKSGSQVFGLYKRFHSHAEGKGMGLYMVKTQVEMLGGIITVNSEVNKGTEFRIEFENEHDDGYLS
jgi:PAS domain S-box-containing protein